MKPIEDAVATFRKVRKLRQKPAHALEEDRFDQAIFRQQRELVIEAYSSVRLIRLVLANHPACKDVKVDSHLYEGKVTSF